ncbi:hypothetical protein OIU77_006593 [Salix suchowensis]|uniref:Uncharacterized protein n=1 Tax=Salix suchowensis TaxID=1278906 RepID=A0ABQ9AMN5_9ROSI|nr:hypothetical protein OIU77_006593 [Salix suchowensis]
MINEAKPDFEAKLERLKKLSEMEAESFESMIRKEEQWRERELEMRGFLREEAKEIIKKCQEAEMSLRQGLMLAKKAEELL